MNESPVDFTPRAPAHLPSAREWASFAISLLVLVVLIYSASAYLSYREKTAVTRSAAAQLLLTRQQPAPSDFGDVRERLELGGDEGVENYRAQAPDGSGSAPGVLLCTETCADQDSVPMELAFGVHHDFSGAADIWDFWFAPVHEGGWVADPARLLYRIVPDQSESWGVLGEPWTDTGVSFSENRIGGVYELDDTALADYLHQTVDDREVERANRLGAPVESLTIHSDSDDRAGLITPPGWRPVGEALEDVRADLPDFLAEASSDRTFGEWIGDNWWELLSLCLLLLGGLFYAVRGWWAVGVYGYHWFGDELQKEKLERD